jgi:hypothetical protein
LNQAAAISRGRLEKEIVSALSQEKGEVEEVLDGMFV